MDRAAFYATLRQRGSGAFGTALSQSQVEGIENLLDVWEQHFSDGLIDELAYDLATIYHETAHTMQPITERGKRAYFNKYEPGTKLGRILGNTQPGDGYRYRGEGHVQNTGRGNAAKATKRLNEAFGLGIDLVANPAQRGDPKVSALSLFLGNREGWWTGLGLNQFIDGVDETDDEDVREWVNARRVVNGTDKAKLIAGYALAFERALKAAGYEPRPKVQKPERPAAGPNPHPKAKTPLAVVVTLLIALGGGLYAFLKSAGVPLP